MAILIIRCALALRGSDHILGVRREDFHILGKPPTFAPPGEGSFYDPAYRQHRKAIFDFRGNVHLQI